MELIYKTAQSNKAKQKRRWWATAAAAGSVILQIYEKGITYIIIRWQIAPPVISSGHPKNMSEFRPETFFNRIVYIH